MGGAAHAPHENSRNVSETEMEKYERIRVVGRGAFG